MVGAHTLGYNDDSFAMSAIGNFETAQAPEAMLRAYGALFAWKLGLAGIDPMDRSQNVSGDHVPGDQRAPRRRLDRLPGPAPVRRSSRRSAATPPRPAEPEPEPEEPDPVTLRQGDSDLAATPYPDLVVRRASDGRGMVLPTGGLTSFRAPATLVRRGWGSRSPLATPDLTGDDQQDLVTFDDSGSLEIRPGPAADGYRTVARLARGFRGHDLVASTGDLDDDGLADLVARSAGPPGQLPADGQGRLPPGGPGHQAARATSSSSGAGDVTGDGDAGPVGPRRQPAGSGCCAGEGDGSFADRAQVATDLTDVDCAGRRRRLHRRRAPGPAGPRGRAGRCSCCPRGATARSAARSGRSATPPGSTMVSGAGQVTGNAAPDLVAVGPGGSLVVLPNRGTFDLGQPINTGQSFSRGDLLLNAGDFDGDGHGDVIAAPRDRVAVALPGQGHRPAGGPAVDRRQAALRGRHRPAGRPGRHRATTAPTSWAGSTGETMVWPGNGADGLEGRQPIDGRRGRRRRGRPGRLRLDDRDQRPARPRAGPTSWCGTGTATSPGSTATRSGYGAPRTLGEAGGYDLGG